MQYPDYNTAFFAKGGVYVADTSAHAGPFSGIFAHTECVIASMTCAAADNSTATWTGTLTNITIPQGCFFPFPGKGGTALTLTSGTATLVNQ